MNEPWPISPAWTGGIVLTILWQSTLWLTVGLLAGHLLRRHAARAHLVLVLAMAAALISPVLTATVRQLQWGVLPVSDSTMAPAAPGSEVVASLREPFAAESDTHDLGALQADQKHGPKLDPITRPHELSHAPEPPPKPTQAVPAANAGRWFPISRERLPFTIGAAWIVCSLAISIRLVAILLAGRRVVRLASVETHPKLLEALNQAAGALALGSEPVLRTSPAARCPMIWCWGRQPILVTPKSAAVQDGVTWLSVFCHELAHWLRRDHWSWLFAEVLVVAIPWHPLAWRTRRSLSFLREQACDDWVLAAGAEAIDYAESLVNLVPQSSQAYALAAVRSRESLKQRLEHVLAGVRVPPTVGRRWLAAAALIFIAAAAGVAVAQQRTVVARKSDTSSALVASEQPLIVSGRVINGKGEFVAGAVVAVVGRKKLPPRGGDLKDLGDVLGQATTSGDGKFHMSLAGASSKSYWSSALLAGAGGYGLAWRPIDLDAQGLDEQLRLPDEQVLRGRLVDLQGQPAQKVPLRVAGVQVKTTGDTPSDSAYFGRWTMPPTAWPQLIVDLQGRFTIHGVGIGYGVLLQVDGNEQFAPQFLTLNTGMREQRAEGDATYRPNSVRNVKPGEEAILVVASAQIAEGVVRFADTKLPVPYARLVVGASQQKIGGSGSPAPGRTNEQGRFRVIPYPGVRFDLTAYPPDGTPYLIRTKNFDFKPGELTTHVDVELVHGVLVRGKIVEAADNRPIENASIQFIPQSNRRFQQPEGVVTGWQGIQLSRANGEFAISVLPGPGRLLVHGPTNDYVLHVIGERELNGNGTGGERNYAHAIKRIDPASGSPAIETTIALERGSTVSGTVLAPEGRLAGETLMVSRLQVWPSSLRWRGDGQTIRGGRFSLSGLTVGVEYPVYFLDPDKKLGGAVRLRAKDASPASVEVRLAPCGTAKARFVDFRGAPIAGLRQPLMIVVTPGPPPFSEIARLPSVMVADEDFVAAFDRKNHWPTPTTDREGRVIYRCLIPGATYRLHGPESTGGVLIKNFTVEAGQTLDLGDVLADRPERS
jgi:beta-lactamase regulating signal transducer with metallopeptidase domain